MVGAGIYSWGGGTFLKRAPQGAHLEAVQPLLQRAGMVPCVEVVRLVLPSGFLDPKALEVLTLM